MVLAFPYQPAQRTATGRIWEGKKLLVDFDGTLAECGKKDENSRQYELRRVRNGADATLRMVGERGGRCFITSAGHDSYVREMAGKASLLSLFEHVFDCDDLRVMMIREGEDWRATAKSYVRVMEHVSEGDPAANCAVIGNDPGLDVPRSPQGVVTVLSSMDADFSGIVSYLEALLLIGKGSFAAGFDRVHPCGSTVIGGTRVRTVSEGSWLFRGIGTGKARVALFGMDEGEIAYHIQQPQAVAV
ncbi:MAG: HAD family hydrolase [Candidatus Micrarchaeota archaeon]